MTPAPENARRAAMRRLQERARRISRIRRTVVAGALATFTLAWGLSMNDQLASGTKTNRNSNSHSNEPAAVPSTTSVPVAPVQVAPTPAPAPLTTSQS